MRQNPKRVPRVESQPVEFHRQEQRLSNQAQGLVEHNETLRKLARPICHQARVTAQGALGVGKREQGPERLDR